MRPVAVLEDGFRDMIKVLEPGYQVQSQKYYTRLLKSKYEASVILSS